MRPTSIFDFYESFKIFIGGIDEHWYEIISNFIPYYWNDRFFSAVVPSIYLQVVFNVLSRHVYSGSRRRAFKKKYANCYTWYDSISVQLNVTVSCYWPRRNTAIESSSSFVTKTTEKKVTTLTKTDVPRFLRLFVSIWIVH